MSFSYSLSFVHHPQPSTSTRTTTDVKIRVSFLSSANPNSSSEMKISAGTIGFKTQLQLQCRAFLIPWVEKKSVITCLKKNRDYSSSSVPARYIPKKSSQSKKSESSNSETMEVLKRKDFSEFSDASPPLDNEVGYGGNSVQKGFDFDMKSRYRSQMSFSNLRKDGVEQNDLIEEPEAFSEEDNVMEGPEELRIHGRHNSHCDQDVFQPFENKTKNILEKFASSDGGNAEQKSFNFDAKRQHRGQMLASNVLINDDEQDTIMEEPEEVSDDDDILEECEEELDEEPMVDFSSRQQNRYCERDVLKPQENKTTRDAEKLAIKLLATRAFTTFELKKKLCGKGFSTNIVEAVISDFQSRGLLKDSWFAEAYCQSRWSSSTWGPRRIKQELSRKGVSNVDSENAIDVVFRDGESDEYRESSQGLSKTSMDRLFVQASKQWLRGRDVPKETRKSRIIRWLQYRGFSWDVVGVIVKKLESNHQP